MEDTIKNVSRRSANRVEKTKYIDFYQNFVIANSDFSETLISFTYSVAIHISNKSKYTVVELSLQLELQFFKRSIIQLVPTLKFPHSKSIHPRG